MAQRTRSEHEVPLTPEDLERFHRNAPAALARRGGAFFREEVLAGLQMAVFGLLPILGILFWGWSAPQMLAFLLIGAWVGILCDTAKVALLRRRAEAYAAAMYDDYHVWVVADALRKGRSTAAESHLRAKWNPLGGVFVDFVMGGISTLMIVVQLVHERYLTAEVLRSPAFVWGVAGLAVVRVLSTITKIVHHRGADRLDGGVINPDQDRPVKAMVGMRGVGLFLLVFLVAIVADSESAITGDAARFMMLVVNGLVALWGLVAASSPFWLAGETRWLRQYLARRERQTP